MNVLPWSLLGGDCEAAAAFSAATGATLSLSLYQPLSQCFDLFFSHCARLCVSAADSTCVRSPNVKICCFSAHFAAIIGTFRRRDCTRAALFHLLE